MYLQTNVKYQIDEVITLKTIFLKETNTIFYKLKSCLISRIMCVVKLYIYVNTTLHLYWPIYRNNRYRVVRQHIYIS